MPTWIQSVLSSLSQWTAKDWFTVILAAWGAILSTVLGGYQILKDRKNVTISLIKQIGISNVQFRITNISSRTFVADGIGIAYFVERQDEKHWNEISQSKITGNMNDDAFPITLTDGKHVTLDLGSDVFEELEDEDIRKIRLTVVSADGKKYKGTIKTPKVKPMRGPNIAF